MIGIEDHDELNEKRVRFIVKLMGDLTIANTISANAKTIKEHQRWLRTAIEIERDISKVDARDWRP